MADRFDQVAALATLTATQQRAVDMAVKQERKSAVEQVRHRIALGPAAMVVAAGVGTWGWLAVGAAASLGIESTVLVNLLAQVAAQALVVALLTAFASAGVYAIVATIMGGLHPGRSE